MSYPSSINDLVNKSDGVDQTIHSDHINSSYQGLRDVATVLGDLPQGSLSSIQSRLEVLTDEGGLLKPIGDCLIVGKTGCKYSTVQSAVDAATTNVSFILIMPGVYEENVSFNKNLMIMSFSPLYQSIPRSCIQGNCSFSGTISVSGIYFRGNLTFPGSEAQLRASFCSQSSGTITLGEYSTFNLRYCHFSGNIVLTEEVEAYLYYSHIGAFTGNNDSYIYSYHSFVGNVYNGVPYFYWSKLGTCVIRNGARMLFNILTSFSGSGGLGAYNVDGNGNAISVP